MKKRVLRSALAVAAAGSRAGAVLVQSAGAQTALSVLTTSVAFSGPVPSGVSGVLVTVACRPIAGVTGDQTQTAQFGATGGSTALSFGLLAVGSASAPPARHR